MADYSLGTAHGQITIDADTSGVDKAEQAMGRLDKSSTSTTQTLDRTARGMGIAGAAIAGGLGFAVKTAMDFDAQLSAIAAVGGRDAVARMGEIREAALRIGTDTKFSASEAAAAMEELVKAGIPVEDVLNGAADATVALAAATGVDMPTAAGIASNAMNVFNLRAEDMTKVADLMAQAANASAIDVTDLGMSMQQVGAVAHLTGLSLEDTIIAIGEMGDAGIKGSDAGTSLKTMLSNLQPTTEKQTETMKELGLITEDGSNAFYDQEGRVKSLRDIQDILNDATKDLTAQQKQMALETIFGSDAIRAAAVLADGGAEAYDNFGDKMDNAGTAAEQAKIRQDNLKGSLEQLGGSLETAAIAVGSALTPAIRGLTEILRSAVDWFTSLDEGTQQIIVTVAASLGGLLLFGAALIKTVTFVRRLTETLRVLRIIGDSTNPGFIKMAATAVASFAKMVFSAIYSAGVIIGQWTVAVAQTVAAWAMAAAQAVVHGAAVAAAWVASAAQTVAQWVIMGTQATVQALKVAGAWLLTVGQAAATALASMVATVARFVAQWVIMGAQALAQAARVALAWLVAMGPVGWVIALLAVVVGVVIYFWDDISSAFQTGSSFIKRIWNEAWTNIKAVWDWIVNVFRTAGQWIVNAIQNTWTWIKNLWNSIISFLRQIPGWVGGIFASAASWLYNAGRNILTGLWNGVKNVWNSFIAWIRGIPGWIRDRLSDAGSWLLGIGEAMVHGLWNGISNALGWLWDRIRGMAESIVNSFASFYGVHSPSTLFRDEIGRWLPAGIAVGIDANADEAVKSALAMAEAVSGAVSMSVGGPDNFWDGTHLGVGNVPPSPEVVSHSAAQGESPVTPAQRVINFNTYNPVAERASDSEARRLRALSALGAF